MVPFLTAINRELLTKWPSSVGRTKNFEILDQPGSLAVLEANLEKLPLQHYLNLFDPALDLVHVLRAISRCKDELITPDQYLAEAESALSAAETEETQIIAEKAIEVAKIYQVYDDELRRSDCVDFGDLILLAVDLIANNPEVQNHVSGFQHVLVDEYQDVNYASSRLLQGLASAGANVWAVADARQSIYRFRGAEPTNVSRFVSEFNGNRHSLKNNYRSFGSIIRTFEHFSQSMGNGNEMAGSWSPHRGEGGAVTMTVTPTMIAEAESIGRKIEEFRDAGIAYGEQAILARTHLTLARITGVLEKLGVPLLYLGDLFERDEIRALLSLISIDAEYGGIGLIRVATLPQYGATRDDALAVLGWSKSEGVPVFESLKRVGEIEGVSESGCSGLEKLGAELDGLQFSSPWKLLTDWLFERSDYLRSFLLTDDIASQQQLVAIYHLLKVCAEQFTLGNHSRKAFVDRVRRIEALNQDSSYCSVASEAAGMDAVQVMTIHGSKGLEFSAVHLPGLATRYMPTSRQGTRCPPPPSLAHLAIRPQDHDAEEECLFFVALSRARDGLSLSRAERYTLQNSAASKFISRIQGVISSYRHNGTGASFSAPDHFFPPQECDQYAERHLSLYMKCPARYRYEVIEGLYGSRDESPYIQFHRCVYTTVHWLEQQREKGQAIDAPSALSHLAENWAENGPVGHAFEGFYRTSADAMVKGMATAISSEAGHYDRREWAIPVDNGIVTLTPDRVVVTPDGAVHVQRIRTGRETASESKQPIYALLRRGAEMQYPGKPIVIEAFYLSTGKTVVINASNDDKSLGKYSEAIAEIQNGNFQPNPSNRTCPKCQCYFACQG